MTELQRQQILELASPPRSYGPALIARHVGCSPTSVTRILRKAGVRVGWPEFAKANGYRSTWR